MGRLRKNATEEEVERWNTKKAEKLSTITAKKEALQQKLAGLSQLKLQQYYDRQAKLKEGRDKWLAQWRGMSKTHKELYRHQKKSAKITNRQARAEKKQLKEQKKKLFAQRRQQRKDYPILYKRMKEEWENVAATAEPNKRNVAAKSREIYKHFKLVNWDNRKLKSYNRAAERRRHHYHIKTYDPFLCIIEKREKRRCEKRTDGDYLKNKKGVYRLVVLGRRENELIVGSWIRDKCRIPLREYLCVNYPLLLIV